MWSCLCPTPAQLAACKAAFCNTQFGALFNNSLAPLSALTGGVIPQCCPNDANNKPNPADLLLPPDGALGAAARIKQDEAEAKARRAAVRYLGTAECNRWPEAKEALANALRLDHNECVRMEAAWALGRGCCCNRRTIIALAMCVSGSDEDGAPRECSERVRLPAMAALEHCLACFVEVVPVPVEVKKPEGLPKPPEGGKPEPLPKPDAGTNAKAARPTATKVSFYERVDALPADYVLRFGKAALQRARGNTVSPLPTGSHSIYDVARTAFAPEGVSSDVTTTPSADGNAVVETAPPPPLRPVPVPAAPAATSPGTRIRPVTGQPATQAPTPIPAVWQSPDVPPAAPIHSDPMPRQAPATAPMPYPYAPGGRSVTPPMSTPPTPAPHQYPYAPDTASDAMEKDAGQALRPAAAESGVYPYTPGGAAPTPPAILTPASAATREYPYAPATSPGDAETPGGAKLQGAATEAGLYPYAPGSGNPAQVPSTPAAPMTREYPYAPGEEPTTPPGATTPRIRPTAATSVAVVTPPMPPSIVVNSVAAEGPGMQHLVVLLEKSQYVDVRQYAVKRIISSREPVTNLVIEALVKSAAKDTDVGVRVACVHGLMQLNVNDPLLPELADYLKNDHDSQVRLVGEELGRWYRTHCGSSAGSAVGMN
jgi:hypothetical protein